MRCRDVAEYLVQLAAFDKQFVDMPPFFQGQAPDLVEDEFAALRHDHEPSVAGLVD